MEKLDVTLQMNRKLYSGAVTYEVPCFDEYLSKVEKMTKKCPFQSQSYNLDWAKGLFEIFIHSFEKQAYVFVKLGDLQRGSDSSVYLWEWNCICSIAGDNEKLFHAEWNNCGQDVVQDDLDPVTIEQQRGFRSAAYLAAAKAFGKPSTLRIVLEYQAIRYDQLALEYSRKPECPSPKGIYGNPGLLDALHPARAESDFIISCGGQEYPVHRVILKWASPVFCRMIETPMQEASSNKLVISDVESKVVEMMIDFIYKARIDVVLDNEAVSLLYCAEKYELVALKENCLIYMKTVVSDTNVTEFLSTAIKCNAGEVVKELVDWCKKRFWILTTKEEFRAFFEANLELFLGEK